MNFMLRVINRLNSELRTKCFQLLNIGSISVGKHVRTGKGSRLAVSGKGHLYIGDNTFINRNCNIVAHDNIHIGNDCLLGVNVNIFDHDHRFRDASIPISRQGFKTAPISIGNNCWIGSNVFISKGVSIGDNSVVSACSRIDKSVPPNTLVRVEGNVYFEKLNQVNC